MIDHMGECLSGDEDYYDFDHDSLDGLDSEEPRTNWNPRKISSSQVITKESLLSAQMDDMRRVMDYLPVKEHHARTLLIHHRWDVDKLLAVYADKGIDRLFAEAGVSVTLTDHSKPASLSFASSVTCEVCMEDISNYEVSIMDCGHCFCNSCWTEHFIVKINEGQSRRIKCMAYKCNDICDEAIVRNLVRQTHPDLAEKFEKFLLESYIEDNKMVKWCPSAPHCGNAIRVEDDEVDEVECSCGMQFCFKCSEEPHSPCSCLMWELWSKKCKDESETKNWMTVNTKPCPKCHKPVEKNGGCNLVRCICGQAFCWLCAEATGRDHTWASIAGHSCGRFLEDHAVKAARAKRDLLRYTHYHNFYKAHTDSLKLESKLKETLQEKVLILEEKRKTKIKHKDFDWVTDGLQRLFRSRRVLSYSYPFVYYMFGDDLFKDEMTKEETEMKKNLFEDQQQQLEANIERLSKLLEAPLDTLPEDGVLEIRMQVLDLCNITDYLCKKMYDCIENDLLGSLQHGTHNIAPYKSKGIERASELVACFKSSITDKRLRSDNGSNGETSEPNHPSGSGNSYSSNVCFKKRARKEGFGGSLFYLNLPADIVDGD